MHNSPTLFLSTSPGSGLGSRPEPGSRELHRQGVVLGRGDGVPEGTPAWVQWRTDDLVNGRGAFAGDNSYVSRISMAQCRALLDALENQLATPPDPNTSPPDAALAGVNRF